MFCIMLHYIGDSNDFNFLYTQDGFYFIFISLFIHLIFLKFLMLTTYNLKTGTSQPPATTLQIFHKFIYLYTGLFISPSGTSELDCATTKKDTAERSISIGRESLKVFFVLGVWAYLQVPPLRGSRDEKWRAQ